jgi:hypothetical protein
MRFAVRAAVFLGLLGSGVLAPVPVRAQEPPDFPLTDSTGQVVGHFYKQANGQGGAGDTGFAVTDAEGIPFWSTFQALGGPDAVGYPISGRFLWDGMVTQAFQKLIFQWNNNQVAIVNVIDLFTRYGRDDWLQVEKQVPPVADWLADRTRSWAEIVAAHQALLDRFPAIKEVYFRASDPIALYGLPQAAADYPTVSVIRAQRAVFQQWKVNTPWAVAGQVTIANGADVAKEAGILASVAGEALRPTQVTASPAGGGLAIPPTAAGLLVLKLSVSDPNPPAGGAVTVRAELTDTAGRPQADAIVILMGRFSADVPDLALFLPNTDGRGHTSQTVNLPTVPPGTTVRFEVQAIIGSGDSVGTSFTLTLR